jgi:predicted DCC family thiol-disulfide oxidoreductase YuxK
MGQFGLPVLVYDGECGFCTACASWLARRWTRPARAVPWQLVPPDELERWGITVAEAAAAAWWVDEQGRSWRGHLAVARGLAAVGGGWGAVGRSLGVVPVRWLAAAVYPVVVRHRGRLPGTVPACGVDLPPR